MQIGFLLTVVAVLATSTSAWTSQPQNALGQRRRVALNVRRGQGNLGKQIGDENIGNVNNMNDNGGGAVGMGSSGRTPTGAASSVNWLPIAVSAKTLPTEENQVGLIDTNLFTLKNGQTNPTGAVSVIKYQGQTYCFSVNCPSCQIPLTKATCLPPAPKDESNNNNNGHPRLVCDFCKATYNVKTGDKLPSAVANAGFLGGIAKSLFSSKESGPLPVYKLGEKGGKLLIAL